MRSNITQKHDIKAIGKEKRRKSLKIKILAKGRILFWKKGYRNTTVKDIASACGCQAGNVYNYFPSKEAILYTMLREEMEHVISSIKYLEDEYDMTPIEQLRILISKHINLTLGYRRAEKILFDLELRSLTLAHQKKIIKYRDEYERIMCKILRRGIESGYFAEIDEKIICYSIASMIVRSRIWFRPKGRLTPAEISDIISDFVLDGLRVVR